MNTDEGKSPVRKDQKPQEVSTPLSSCKDMVFETPTTPLASATPVKNDDEADENELNLSNASIATEHAFHISATPGPIKARRQLEENKFLNSPSDALLSPCTAALLGRGGKKATSGPAAVIRKKQTGSIPFKINDD